MNSLSIPSSQGGRTFSLSKRKRDYFDASISGDSLSAKRTIYSYFYEDAFIELFDYMATNWKGWTGEKTWESVEGELKLTATSDKLGHVTLLINLRNQNSEDNWAVQAPIFLDSGNLDEIARKVRSFFCVSEIQA
jgi:hypothetical protein